MAASLPWRRDEKPAEISWLASDPGGTGPADHATSDDPRRYRVGTISTSNAIRALKKRPQAPPQSAMGDPAGRQRRLRRRHGRRAGNLPEAARSRSPPRLSG